MSVFSDSFSSQLTLSSVDIISITRKVTSKLSYRLRIRKSEGSKQSKSVKYRVMIALWRGILHDGEQIRQSAKINSVTNSKKAKNIIILIKITSLLPDYIIRRGGIFGYFILYNIIFAGAIITSRFRLPILCP